MSAELGKLVAPEGRGFLELLGTASQRDGLLVQGKLGVKPWENAAAYLYGEASSRSGWLVGLGGRIDF